jgi:hypothetical protein
LRSRERFQVSSLQVPGFRFEVSGSEAALPNPDTSNLKPGEADDIERPLAG